MSKNKEMNPSHFESMGSPDITESKPDIDYRKEIKGWTFFDPHIHMVSRTTDDYQALADAGVVGIIEPAFWVGQPRTGLATFRDYYNSLKIGRASCRERGRVSVQAGSFT